MFGIVWLAFGCIVTAFASKYILLLRQSIQILIVIMLHLQTLAVLCMINLQNFGTLEIYSLLKFQIDFV